MRGLEVDAWVGGSSSSRWRIFDGRAVIYMNGKYFNTKPRNR